MNSEFTIGDFDFEISDVLLVHKFMYKPKHKMTDYKKGRNMAGFVYCISGEAVYEFTDSTCTLKEGQMIFLSPNCSYTIKNPSAEPFIHITANFAMRSHGCCDQSVFAGIMNGVYSSFPISEDSARLAPMIERLLSVWQIKGNGYRVMAKSLLYEMMYLYLNDMAKKYRKNTHYSKISSAKKYIDANFDRDISVRELADMCGLSETHFRRLFVQTLGMSPTDYRIDKRILKAKDLLLTGDYNVGEIAEQVGFEDANYFSRIFKKKTGSTPKEYMEMY